MRQSWINESEYLFQALCALNKTFQIYNDALLVALGHNVRLDFLSYCLVFAVFSNGLVVQSRLYVVYVGIRKLFTVIIQMQS